MLPEGEAGLLLPQLLPEELREELDEKEELREELNDDRPPPPREPRAKLSSAGQVSAMERKSAIRM